MTKCAVLGEVECSYIYMQSFRSDLTRHNNVFKAHTCEHMYITN